MSQDRFRKYPSPKIPQPENTPDQKKSRLAVFVIALTFY
jgi:hypothetical protein